jgi:hypothetical protein
MRRTPAQTPGSSTSPTCRLFSYRLRGALRRDSCRPSWQAIANTIVPSATRTSLNRRRRPTTLELLLTSHPPPAPSRAACLSSAPDARRQPGRGRFGAMEGIASVGHGGSIGQAKQDYVPERGSLHALARIGRPLASKSRRLRSPAVISRARRRENARWEDCRAYPQIGAGRARGFP